MAKKMCPECQKKQGVRTHKCECGYSFISAKKEVVAEVVEKKTHLVMPEVLEMPEHVKLTPKEHAERILGYGKDRAALLLQFAKMGHRWSHVDWDVVALGLEGS